MRKYSVYTEGHPEHKVFILIDGRMYSWHGWFGCQLQSVEKRRLGDGETRFIAGRLFRVFSTYRCYWGKVQINWALVPATNGTPQNYTAQIEDLKKHLRSMV